MDYSIFKSIHIIFVVSYFAGIFYIVRLFIYHTEALENSDEQKRNILHNQFCLMEERLWNIITVPAFIIMTICGLYMLYLIPAWLSQGWLHVKLFAFAVLVAYHIWCWRMIKNLKNKRTPYTSVQLRMLNEVATLILFVTVFAVVLKHIFITYWYISLLTFVLMGLLIMAIVKIVNKGKK